MNKVTAGGRTVFPRVGAGVEPVAGSAVFWYNIKKNGDPDRLTLHGACPILYGTKWGKIDKYIFIIPPECHYFFSVQQVDSRRRSIVQETLWPDQG